MTFAEENKFAPMTRPTKFYGVTFVAYNVHSMLTNCVVITYIKDQLHKMVSRIIDTCTNKI